MAQGFVDIGPSNVIFVYGEEEAEQLCHTFPLAAHSPVLRTLLTVNMLERSMGQIRMPDVNVDCGRQFLYFLYTGHVQEDANLLELLAAADAYTTHSIHFGYLLLVMATISEFCTIVNEYKWTLKEFPILVKTMENTKSMRSPKFDIQIT